MENPLHFTLNSYYTLIAATFVLLFGRLLVRKIKLLSDFNIPEPVAGGLVVAAVLFALHQTYGFTISIDENLQRALMLMFFASIGLSADFSRLKKGGLPLVIFTIIVGSFILVQDLVGVSMAKLLGLEPVLGLIAGSVTLTGGHGTAGAWGQIFETKYGIQAATTIGIACATYGLVSGGIIGGPVARRLIDKYKLSSKINFDANAPVETTNVFEHPHSTRLITPDTALEVMGMFAICLSASFYLTNLMDLYFPDTQFKIPTFVWALAAGVVVRNSLSHIFKLDIFDRCIDVYGNVALSLFLAMALLSLKLWSLTGLALPLLSILVMQTVVMILYAYFITFRIMGKDYDAATLAAGHCGFGLGATPTAVANMQAITHNFGPSHKAFLIVPMVGAFFVDLLNASILSVFTGFLA